MAQDRMRGSGSGSGGSLVLSALGGAVVGAAALGWWLLSEAEQRRRRRPGPPLRLSQPIATSAFQADATGSEPRERHSSLDSRLQDRVQELNRAIEDVRRQLEQLQPLP